MSMELRLQFPDCNVSDRTISRWLDGMLYTVKKVKPIPAERNKPEIIEERKSFATWFLEEGVNADCIYVDETNFNLHTSRTRGRSLRGRDCVLIVGSQKGKNLNILLAVSQFEGIVHKTSKAGGVKSEDLQGFINDLSLRLERSAVL